VFVKYQQSWLLESYHFQNRDANSVEPTPPLAISDYSPFDNGTNVLYHTAIWPTVPPQGKRVTRSRRQQLDQTVALLRKRYGDGIIRRAGELQQVAIPAHISTGFPQLDTLTGCGGLPLDGLTVFSGPATSGKLTIAYKVLAMARSMAALLDLGQSSDPDYLARCGVNLQQLLFVRPQSKEQAVDLLLELVQSRQVKVVVVDSLPDLTSERKALRHLNRSLPQLRQLLRRSGCGVLLLDEVSPPWLRWLGLHPGFPVEQWTDLHIALGRERWLYQESTLQGYQATARLVKSRWARRGGVASLDIVFNGTVQARKTW
jgi:PAS domain-containing protein